MVRRRSCPQFIVDNITVRDATLDDIRSIKIKASATKFFGSHDIEVRYKASVYSFYLQNSDGEFGGYANFECKPNMSSIHPAYWLSWMRHCYNTTEITYGNTIFLTFLQLYDPYNNSILKGLYEEVFLREPKIKFICNVAPPVDSIYEDILSVHCKRIRSLDESVNRLCQSLFIAERYDFIPKMRFRHALAEDNDDLIEIIDEKLKAVRLELGDFYIAETVLRNDPTENIVVAEISHMTVGMIWINTNVHQKVLSDNFEISAFGYFIRPQGGRESVDIRIAKGVIRKPLEASFKLPNMRGSRAERKSQDDKRLSLNNLYLASVESIQTAASLGSLETDSIYKKWDKMNKSLKNPDTYLEETVKAVKAPKTLHMTNAFVIQLFGLTKSVDPRRYFDLIAAAFAAYEDKDYCLISLSSSEASSDAIAGYLLRYFSRVVPRSGCKISDCLYVTHRNSFTLEIEVDFVADENDYNDIKGLLDSNSMVGKGIYASADILQIMNAFALHGWAQHTVIIMRSAGACIGFALLRQNTMMSELCANFKVYDDDDAFPVWRVGEILYLLLHPAFMWEWVHVARQIFRLTYYFSMYFRFESEPKKPILNSILLAMFPIFPRKRIKGTDISSYSLYYLNIKMCHIVRDHVERKLVILGFNEACKGFLRTLFYSYDSIRVLTTWGVGKSESTEIQCLNITVIAKQTGRVEAEHDIKCYPELNSLFYEAKNQFTTDYMRRFEYRTWIRFIEGRVERIIGDKKRINLYNGTTVRYDRLYLMCSNRHNTPKPFITAPSNYMEINNRLDSIAFYLKMSLFVKDFTHELAPILIYGEVILAHACIRALLQLGVNASIIHLIIPPPGKRSAFPESFDDDYVTDLIFFLERQAGVKILTGLKFVDWKLYETENVIENVTFESDFQSITIKCTTFISYYTEAVSPRFANVFATSGLEIENNRVIIDEYSKTSIPYVYACGRVTRYKKELFAGEIEQCYYNQIDVGNKMAHNLIKQRKTGKELCIVDSYFKKPLFRQTELIEGIIYGAVRAPGRYTSHCIRKNFKNFGSELITNNDGEYCRVLIDVDGFITEITCLTRKYARLDIIYRIYNVHQSMLNNVKLRCERGEIRNLLDYFHSDAFAVVFHDQFLTLKGTMRKNNIKCLKDLIKDFKKHHFNREEIEGRLNLKGMNTKIRDEVYKFIKKHWMSLHPNYALPEDFEKITDTTSSVLNFLE